jgi:hypothetical protein
MTQSATPHSQDDPDNEGNEAQNAPPLANRSHGEHDNPPPLPQHDDSESHSERTPWWRDRHFVVQMLIFVVTIAIAWIYKGQLKEMVESNRISRESLQSVQRALLNFSGISGGVSLTSPDGKSRIGITALLNWNNTGNTPAKRVIGVGNYQTWRGELPDSFDFHDFLKIDKNTYSQEVVGPHQTLPVQIFVPTDNLRAQRAGSDRLFFYGWIVYGDVFKGSPDRLTEFCSEMIQVSISEASKDIGDPTNNIGWNTQPCRLHNCYDEDCEDYSAKVKYARESR